MTAHQYNRPPITEAVIEIRLANPLSRKTLEKIHNRLRRSYDASEQISAIEFVFDSNKKELEKKDDQLVGYKLTSKDQADIVQIRPNSMACSRLAPYDGWETFEPRARENWESWTRTAKSTKIQRIGVRYLNRIDIPVGKDDKIEVEDYLTIFPKYPEPQLFRSMSKYTMQIVGPFSDEGFNLIVNTNVVKSPLIDHVSVVLDLDLSPEGDVPQREGAIWELVNRMREHKNNAFEMCVTDMARELFL